MLRVGVFAFLICLAGTKLFGQGENALMTLAYGQKAVLSYSADDKLYEGKYNAARRRLLNSFKQLYEAESGPITIGGQKGVAKNRPDIIKRMDEVSFSELTDAGKRTYSAILNRAGIYYHTRGQLNLADYLFNRSLKIRGDLMGRTSQLYIATLHNIAILRKDQGRFDAAEDIMKYVVQYYSQVNGPKSREYIIALANNAMLNGTMGRLKLAVSQMEEALELQKANHDNVLSIDQERMMVNLGLLYAEEGKVSEAKQLFSQAKAGFESKGFDNHPDYNVLIIYLGQVYLSLNDQALITPLLEEAIEKVKKEVGENHPYYANILELQGEFQLKNGQYSEALILLNNALAIRREAFGDRHKDYLKALSKVALVNGYLGNDVAALSQFKQSIEGYLEITSQFFKNMSETEQAAFWRKFNENINSLYEYAAQTSPTNELIELLFYVRLNTKGLLLNNNRKVKQQILSSGDDEVIMRFNEWQSLKEELSGYYSLSKEQLAEEEIDIAAIEQKANSIEKELVLASEVFSNKFLDKNTDYRTLQNSLSESQVAIEMIRFKANYSKNEDVSYLALSVSDDGLGLVKIPEGNKLESRYFKYYQNAIKSRITDTLSYQHYWQPIEALTADRNQVFFSPDGVYNAISLQALKTSDGFLAEKFDVFMLNNLKAIKDLQRSQVKFANAYLVGDPAFGSTAISPLPGTSTEIRKIDSLLNVSGYKASQATRERAAESTIKSIENPAILHVATHGFFSESEDESITRAAGMGISSASDHPLLKSGLVLAEVGSIDLEEVQLPFERANNGILTAFEATDLNLTKTKLVVLSACETGLGEVVNGEGVYGLARSFKIAGAEAVIISLWKVDDQATQQLMVQFYQNLIENGDVFISLNRARLAVKKNYADPYYWAPFVLLF